MTIKIQTIYSIRNDTQEVIQHYLSAMSALNRETWSISSRLEKYIQHNVPQNTARIYAGNAYNNVYYILNY